MESVIRRPEAADHFMVLKPIKNRIVIRLPDGTKLAETTRATRVLEVGKTFYDPVVYLPKQEMLVQLTKQGNTTHCPLKGNAHYYKFAGDQRALADLAWSYEEPFDFSKEIAGLIAFYSNKVIVEEHPL
jgi:uncharacterized protein (DUF427 family)